MHYHCEIVMPPTDDVEAAVRQIMAPFDENGSESKDEDYSPKHAFWDYWLIGGRWAGSKQEATYDPEKLEAFNQWCVDEKITVSGFRAGKQELSPADQTPKVDAKWNEMFRPGSTEPCPLFKHSNKRDEPLAGDICKLSEVSASMKCGRVIVARPKWDDKAGKHSWAAGAKAGFMMTDTAWNGCNHMPVDWDRTFGSALEAARKDLEHSRSDWRAMCEPKPDWLVVTVDYHS